MQNEPMSPALRRAAEEYRAAIGAAGESDRATFARRTRNAVAQAVLAAALEGDDDVGEPAHPAPVEEVRAHVGELAAELVALYEGGDDWTSRAIDVLEPLHELARA
jgi:hypothetical protein